MHPPDAGRVHPKQCTHTIHPHYTSTETSSPTMSCWWCRCGDGLRDLWMSHITWQYVWRSSGVDGLDGLMLLVELWTHPVLLCLRSATCTLWATVRAHARTLHETLRCPNAPSGAMDLIWGSTSSTSHRPIGPLRDPLLQARDGMPSSSEVTVYGSVGSWTSGDILALLSLCVLHACYGLQ